MYFNLEALLWYAILIDCIGASIVTLFFLDSYHENFPKLQKIFPLSKGWCIAYFLGVFWIGCLLYRMNILPW